MDNLKSPKRKAVTADCPPIPGAVRGSSPGRFGLSALLFAGGAACAQTHHPVVPSDRGEPSGWSELERAAAESGPVRFEKLVVADWEIDRSGLINLEHPKAAHLDDGLEPISIFLYVIEHPEHGAFLIDSGVARSVAEHSEDVPIRFPVSQVMPHETLRVRLDTASYLESRATPLAGVFLTHLHLDHVLGLTDVPRQVPLYVGPGETGDSRWSHPLTRATTDANLEGFGPLRQWRVSTPAPGQLGVVDIFGDASVLGIHAPGHTDGNMAFLIRSTEGPQLVVGDGCHTAFGWRNGVEPGSFNTDGEVAAMTLQVLRDLAASHPRLSVHLGHQLLPDEQLTSETRLSAAKR